jgi:DNA-binding response OmpR family regulator
MSEKIKIVLAEDEPSLAQIIQESLETRNFDVFLANNGNEAYELYKEKNPDILVLDVMMPFKDGFTLAKEVREENKKIPIIFLTAKSQTKDVLEGFKHGGNDYLKKPFSMEELIVRIHSLLQRTPQKQEHTKIKIGKYSFNHTRQLLLFEEEEIILTNRESELLFVLTQNKNTISEKTYILNKLWGNDDFFNARSMDVFMTKLRKKLKLDENIQIMNIRGYGYKLIC